MDFSVGDLAEQILAQEEIKGKVGAPVAPTFQPDESIYSPKVGDQAPDISQVEVPDDFIASITENKAPVIEEATVEEPVIETVEEPSIVSEASELRLLMEELKELLGEMKTTLIEMTACGSLGVNMAGPTDKDDEKEKKDSMKDILSRIKKKRKTKS